MTDQWQSLFIREVFVDVGVSISRRRWAVDGGRWAWEEEVREDERRDVVACNGKKPKKNNKRCDALLAPRKTARPHLGATKKKTQKKKTQKKTKNNHRSQ